MFVSCKIQNSNKLADIIFAHIWKDKNLSWLQLRDVTFLSNFTKQTFTFIKQRYREHHFKNFTPVAYLHVQSIVLNNIAFLISNIFIQKYVSYIEIKCNGKYERNRCKNFVDYKILSKFKFNKNNFK